MSLARLGVLICATVGTAPRSAGLTLKITGVDYNETLMNADLIEAVIRALGTGFESYPPSRVLLRFITTTDLTGGGATFRRMLQEIGEPVQLPLPKVSLSLPPSRLVHPATCLPL